MAKSPMPAAPAAKPKKTTTTVVYSPLDDAPATTKAYGFTFRANVPLEFDRDNTAHYVEQLMPKVTVVDGEARTKHVDTPVFIPEIAAGNFQFVVDGKRAKRKVSTRKVPPPGAEWTEAHEGEISESDEIDEGGYADFKRGAAA
jgi:hypothetical protein